MLSFIGKRVEDYGIPLDNDTFLVPTDLPKQKLISTTKTIIFHKSVKAVYLDYLSINATICLKFLGKNTQIFGSFERKNNFNHLKYVHSESPLIVGCGRANYFKNLDLDTVYLGNNDEIDSQFFENCKIQHVLLPKTKIIKSFAFCECNIKDISLPNATNIGCYAFYNCENLQTISLPHATEINASAFKCCIDLQRIELPNATEIERNAFIGCTNLKDISLPKAINIGSFAFCQTNLQTISLPDATNIKENEFYGCTNLQTISLPNATNIEKNAFYGCKNLKDISLPKAINIGSFAFYQTNLQTISLPDATNIKENAFYGCTKLERIELPKFMEVKYFQFKNLKNLKFISLSNATEIKDMSFKGCTNLQTISLPNATNIERYAFYNCKSLQNVSLPNATNIEENAFQNCTSLQNVSLPNATKIGAGAFYNCKSLKDVSLPNATKIEESAFIGCTNLQTIELPKATNIGNFAFYDCTNLQTVRLPKNKPVIGNWAFKGCKCENSFSDSNKDEEFKQYGEWNTEDKDEFVVTEGKGLLFSEGLCLEAKKVKFDTSVKYVYLKRLNFRGTTQVKILGNETVITGIFPKNSSENLRYLEIESNSIGLATFKGAKKLETVSLPNATEIDESAFKNCTNLKNISLPKATTIGNNAFEGCTNLQDVSLPSVKKVEDRAFEGCKGKTFNAPNLRNSKGLSEIFKNFENVTVLKGSSTLNNEGIQEIDATNDNFFKVGKLKLRWDDITKNTPLFPNDEGPTIDDIHQKGIGDCWLLAGVGSIVKSNPKLITDCFKDNGETVTVKLYKVEIREEYDEKAERNFTVVSTKSKTPMNIKIKKNLPVNLKTITYVNKRLGELRSELSVNQWKLLKKTFSEIIFSPGLTDEQIENKIPQELRGEDKITKLFKDSYVYYTRYGQSTNISALWVKMFEKAFATLNMDKTDFMQYLNINGGEQAIAMAVITGKTFKIKDIDKSNSEDKLESLFKKIEKRIAKNSPVSASYRRHAYSVVSVSSDETTGEKYIEVRDPNSPHSVYPEIKMDPITGTCKMKFDKFMKMFYDIHSQRLNKT